LARLVLILGALSALLATSSVQAAGGTPLYARLYGDVQFTLVGARHSTINFYPGSVSVSGGAWIRPGVGIDVFADEGAFSDRDGDYEFEVTNASGVAGRFQSPARNGFFAYVLLGLVNVRLVQEENSETPDSRTVVQNYQGGRFSVGIAQQLRFARNLIVTGEYRNYFVDKELQLDALSLGLRLSFR